jgi:hypothetical protein
VLGFKAESERILREYFASASIPDATTSVTDLLEAVSGREGEGDRRRLLRHFVKRAVTVALDHTSREKEFAAQLVSALYPHVLATAHIQDGFMDLCNATEDLKLDIVDAPNEVGSEGERRGGCMYVYMCLYACGRYVYVCISIYVYVCVCMIRLLDRQARPCHFTNHT